MASLPNNYGSLSLSDFCSPMLPPLKDTSTLAQHDFTSPIIQPTAGITYLITKIASVNVTSLSKVASVDITSFSKIANVSIK